MVLLAGAAGLVVLGARGGVGPESSHATPAVPAAPSVEMVPDRHDFGEQPRTTVTTTFEIKNTHPVPVECGPVVKGCSCSSAEVEPNVIPAGGAATLTVTWNLAGKRGPSAEVVSVPYTGAAGVRGFALARLAATVRGVIEPDVEELDLSGAKPVGEVRFRSPTGRPFRCVGAGANHPCLTATLDPAGTRLRVAFDPAVPGWESGKLCVTVATDVPEERELRVWVRVQ